MHASVILFAMPVKILVIFKNIFFRMHDKPSRLEALCIDSLCLSVAAAYDPDVYTLNASVSSKGSTVDISTLYDSPISNPSLLASSRSTQTSPESESAKNNYIGNRKSDTEADAEILSKFAVLSTSSLSDVLADELLSRMNEKRLLTDKTLQFFCPDR